VLKAKFLRA
ncbi:hypothetical protein VTL71DRAFT_9523, partial [Oculimacula yallundae]